MPVEVSVTFQNTGPETWKTESTVSLAQVPNNLQIPGDEVPPLPVASIAGSKTHVATGGRITYTSRLPVRRPLADTGCKFVCNNKGVLSETSRPLSR